MINAEIKGKTCVSSFVRRMNVSTLCYRPTDRKKTVDDLGTCQFSRANYPKSPPWRAFLAMECEHAALSLWACACPSSSLEPSNLLLPTCRPGASPP